MTLEEVDDEEMTHLPKPQVNPPRRVPRVTVEEVEDEDMPRPPGPHLFARHPSPFPEPHPNPTAGVPLRVYPVDRQVPPLYTSKLAEPDVFKEAYWIDNLPISQRAEDEYFKLPRTRNWHWKSTSELDQEIHRLPRGPQWYRETMRVEGDQGDMVLDLWKRDICDMVRWLLGNHRFMSQMRFAPERQHDSATKENQIFGEIWSGNWWWCMQNVLGQYATVAPIILAINKTKMTVFSGNQKAWPVYMSVGNISKDVCRQPSERATLLIGYIPVSNIPNISDKTKRSECGWQLFHACMESILEPLKEVSRTGMDVLCQDLVLWLFCGSVFLM